MDNIATEMFFTQRETLKIPVLGLFDSDPYGLKVNGVLSCSYTAKFISVSLRFLCYVNRAISLRTSIECRSFPCT